MTDQQIERLERLAKLKQDGLLTEEEYNDQKKKLLGTTDETNTTHTQSTEIPTSETEQKPIATPTVPTQAPSKDKALKKPFFKRKIPYVSIGIIIASLVVYIVVMKMRSNAEMEAISAQVREQENSPEALRARLASEERISTSKYLNVIDKKWSRGGLFDPAKVVVVMRNTATLTTYKDIQVEVFWYSETSTQLSSEKFTIYKTIAPGQTREEYITKIHPPSEAGRFSVEIVNCDVVGQ